MNDNYDMEFKKVYNRLEKYIANKYKNDGKISEEILSKDEFKNDTSFWRNYRNLRNIIIHQDSVIHITKDGLNDFKKRVDNVIYPVLAKKICITNLYSAKTNTKLNEVLCEMKAKSYSNVPVLNDDKIVIGVFNYYTLFLYFNNHLDEIIVETDKLKIGDFSKYYSINSNVDIEFGFISKNDSLNQINNKYHSIVSKGKQMGALLVTENGKAKERLLGIITAEDIISANI